MQEIMIILVKRTLVKKHTISELLIRLKFHFKKKHERNIMPWNGIRR